MRFWRRRTGGGGTAEAPSGVRYRVVLVRAPAEGLGALARAIPAGPDGVPREVPHVVRVTGSRESALDTAARLRAAGAAVVVVEEEIAEGVFCEEHTARLVTGICERCDTAICDACRLASGGAGLCRVHRTAARQRARWTRIRQGFVVVLFLLFLHQVLLVVQQDRQAVHSGGPVRVLLVQFAPPGTEDHPLIRTLNRRDRLGEGTALADIQTWYDAEHARYTGRRGPYLDLTIDGPHFQLVRPPELAGPDDGPLRIAWRALAYKRYWLSLARSVGVDPAAYAARLFVVYEAEAGDVASHSRGSAKGRLGIAHIALDEPNPAYAVITVAHELGHVLGADDRYDPNTFLAKYPEGYVEPFVEPLYPQRYGEIMAVDIPLGRDAEAEPRSLAQERVGYRTAAELGWIRASEADYFYRPRAIRPEDRLDDPPRVERAEAGVGGG